MNGRLLALAAVQKPAVGVSNGCSSNSSSYKFSDNNNYW